MKKEQKQEWDANTLCIPYISIHHSLHALCMAVGEGHGVIIGNTQSVIASHSCLCSFFTSHPYILSKYLQLFLFTSSKLKARMKYQGPLLYGFWDMVD